MISTARLRFPTGILCLITLISCVLPAQTLFASRHIHYAQYREDHSQAYKEGMTALDGGAYEKAAEYFKKAAVDKPGDMWAYYYFGLCLLNLKRYDEAAKAYQQAVALKPKVAAAHFQLGKTNLVMGDREAVKKEHRWLQEHDHELALYLSDLLPSDLLPSDKPATQPVQATSVRSAESQSAEKDEPAIEPMTASLKPTILHRESPKYTEIARLNRVQGVVVLKVVFAHNGAIQDIRVIRGLPDGLTRKAIEAGQKIRFKPAIKDGAPVSVRAQLEMSFHLY